MTAQRASLLQPAIDAAAELDPLTLADVGRDLIEAVREAAETAPPGARVYLQAAEKHLLLAVSSLAIANLVDAPPRADASQETPP